MSLSLYKEEDVGTGATRLGFPLFTTTIALVQAKKRLAHLQDSPSAKVRSEGRMAVRTINEALAKIERALQ